MSQTRLYAEGSCAMARLDDPIPSHLVETQDELARRDE
jgi:hypothetical protein